MKKLYLIDPYSPYYESGKLVNISDVFPKTKKRLKKFEEKIEFIRKKSSEAIDDVSDNLDFVYIDGNHAYEFVKKDIEYYYPKVREGGIIGGHDFCVQNIGVCKAVLEFVRKNDLKLYGKNTDWWVLK